LNCRMLDKARCEGRDQCAEWPGSRLDQHPGPSGLRWALGQLPADSRPDLGLPPAARVGRVVVTAPGPPSPGNPLRGPTVAVGLIIRIAPGTTSAAALPLRVSQAEASGLQRLQRGGSRYCCGRRGGIKPACLPCERPGGRAAGPAIDLRGQHCRLTEPAGRTGLPLDGRPINSGPKSVP